MGIAWRVEALSAQYYRFLNVSGDAAHTISIESRHPTGVAIEVAGSVDYFLGPMDRLASHEPWLFDVPLADGEYELRWCRGHADADARRVATFQVPIPDRMDAALLVETNRPSAPD